MSIVLSSEVERLLGDIDKGRENKSRSEVEDALRALRGHSRMSSDDFGAIGSKLAELRIDGGYNAALIDALEAHVEKCRNRYNEAWTKEPNVSGPC